MCEDLNVTGMLTNRRLARAIADQGFGQARRMLSYKTAGTAARWSSPTAGTPLQDVLGLRRGESQAGPVRSHLQCDTCGLVLDRDVNAALNLLHLAASGAESVNACGGTVRPRPARHVPANQEPGTPKRTRPGPPHGNGELWHERHTALIRNGNGPDGSCARAAPPLACSYRLIRIRSGTGGGAYAR